MSKLKDRYLARRKATVVIDDTVHHLVEVKRSLLDTIAHGLGYEGDDAYTVYCDAVESLGNLSSLLEDIGINPDRNYSVVQVLAIRDAIEQALGGAK